MAQPADGLAALFGIVALTCSGLDQNAARGGRQKARDHPQQRGLARAIGAFHRQGLPGR